MEKIKLGDLCISSAGQIKEDADTLIDYIDISSVDNKIKKVTGFQTMSFGEAPSRARKAVKKGSILVSTVRPNLNAVAILEDDTPNISVASTGFCILDCKENVDNRFVFNFCKSKPFIDDMVSQATGASYPAVSDKIVRAALVPKYTYEEQCNISEILDRVSNVIESKKVELSTLDDLIQARFIEMFGDPVINSMKWSEALIGDNCFVTKLAGFEYTQYINYDETGDVVMVKAQNVKNGKLNRKDLSFISEEVSNLLPRSQLAPGDVVMTYVGANIGDVAVIDDEYKYHLAPNVAKIRLDSEIYDSTYFMYMLMLLNTYIVKNSADTAKAALGMERIRKLRVFVPPIELQNQFADFVSQVNKLKVT